MSESMKKGARGLTRRGFLAGAAAALGGTAAAAAVPGAAFAVQEGFIGDWAADGGLGYTGAAVIFAAGLAVLAALYYATSVSRVMLFWAAFILTRPLGAVLGDFLDKPLAKGGLELSRYGASFALLACIVACIVLFPQRAARRAH